MREPDPFSIPEIGKRISTQDDDCTADSIFLVQEKVRIYGIDTDFDPQIALAARG